MRAATRRPSGPPPLPRLRINQPAFYDAVRGSGYPIFRLTRMVGATHGTLVSALVRADSIPASDINISRLEKIAEIIGFPKAKLFLDDVVEAAVR